MAGGHRVQDGQLVSVQAVLTPDLSTVVVAGDLDAASLARVFAAIVKSAGVDIPDVPRGVEMCSRKSGQKLIFPLFYGDTDNGGYIIVASKGGAPQHPGWYRNLLANPEVEVQVGTAKMKARARTATGEERRRLWQEALKFWPPYAEYQRKTEREIPVVVLDPVRP